MDWIPRYIKQTSAKRPGQIITAADWNELFNLVVSQGDYTAEGLVTAIVEFSKGLTSKADLVEGKVPLSQIPEIFKPEGLDAVIEKIDSLASTVTLNQKQFAARCVATEEHLNDIMIGGI